MIDKTDQNQQTYAFLCSICIPTYNRAETLSYTVHSFIESESFRTGKIELVISDNASNDKTQEICTAFHEQYPDQIQYLRLDKVIDPHFNFYNALKHGKGKFLKLNNDHVFFLPGNMDHFIDIIEQYQDIYDLIIPGTIKQQPGILRTIENINDLIEYMSYDITHMNSLCIRETAFRIIQESKLDFYFPHTNILLQLISKNCKTLLTDRLEVNSIHLKYGTHRNEAQVFAEHYIGMLYPYYKKKKITRRVYQGEKRKLLFGHIIPYHFDFFHQYTEHKKVPPFWKHMGYYKADPFFYAALLWIAFYYFISNVSKIKIFRHNLHVFLKLPRKKGAIKRVSIIQK